MTMTSMASLKSPDPKFMNGGGIHAGVWKRKTVTSCWGGKLIALVTTDAAIGSCCCTIIRVGDVFAIARTFGDPKRALREYEVHGQKVGGSAHD